MSQAAAAAVRCSLHRSLPHHVTASAFASLLAFHGHSSPRSSRPAPLCRQTQVRVGACDALLDDIAKTLEAAGDCALVHSIGFTLTFYRQAGLPPPPAVDAADGAAKPASAAASAATGGAAEADSWDEGDEPAAAEDAAEIDEELAAYLMDDEDAFSDSDSEGEDEVQPAAGKRKPPPPEFTVIG